MRAAIGAGVKYAVGTDGMHGGLAKEMEYLTQFGASPDEALAAATARAAEVCGLSDKVGSLQKGGRADVIGVWGDPLRDITALQRVDTVIQGGKLVKSAQTK